MLGLGLAGQLKLTTCNPNTYEHLMSNGEATQPQSAPATPSTSGGKKWLVALLLSIFVGGLGVDRFYLGYTGLGILKLVTCGGFFIWYVYDIIMIATGKMKDAHGQDLIKE